MQAHLCPAMDPFLAQPHITRPLPPASSAFQVCPDQTPMLLSTQLTLLLQPFIDLPQPSPPIPSMFRKQLQVLREKASLPSAPISLSSSSPHLFSIPLCWLCGGPFSPLSIHTGPSVPEPGSSVPGHRKKMEDRTCHSLPLLQGVPVPSVFPQLSVGALDHL